MIYIIHFDRPFHHARHYVGYCNGRSLAERIIRHKSGQGAKILSALKSQNIGWQVVRAFAGDRQEERRIKNCKNTAVFCPICQGQVKPAELFDSYYRRPEISNSDLSIYKNVLMGKPYVISQSAFRLGQAVHERILEPTLYHANAYSDVDLKIVDRLANRFLENEFCQSLLQEALVEQPIYGRDEVTGIQIRCKADILKNKNELLVDIKTTQASSQAAFRRACQQYEYDRQMAFYANAFRSKADCRPQWRLPDVLIVGISKTTNKLFFEEHGSNSQFIKRGKEKYRYLLNKLAQHPVGFQYIYAIRAAYTTSNLSEYEKNS